MDFKDTGSSKIAEWYRARDEWRSRKKEKGAPTSKKKTVRYEGQELRRGCELPYGDKREMRRIKTVMKATRGPYPRFREFYRLDEVVDKYMEIWFGEDSSSSSSGSP